MPPTGTPLPWRWLATVGVASLALAACGGTTTTEQSPRPHPVSRPRPISVHRAPLSPPYPQLLSAPSGTGAATLAPATRWDGQVSVWVTRSPSGVALLFFDQRLVKLVLHSGTIDAGGIGWRFGPLVAGSELEHLIAAFNSGFKLDTGAGGFESYGRTAVPLRPGLGSIVTYADGYTDVGSWHQELPAPGRPIVSVRQNLALLIDHGTAAQTLGCLSCWGDTLGGIADPARSALGVTAGGRLVWAGGEHLTVQDLANALLRAGVVRAAELDINPEWVAAYLYGHRGGKGPLAPVPMVRAQPGVPGQFLTPYGRDFFTVIGR